MSNSIKSLLLLVGTSLCLFCENPVSAQPASLTVVNWNLAWFGSPVNGPTNDDLQEANVKQMLQLLNADLFAFSEIVDTARFGRMIRSLGADWEYTISPYASLAANPSANGYAAAYDSAQKIGFAWNKSIVHKISTRELLRVHGNYTADNNSRYWWSSGRYPFLMNADVTLNGITKNVQFIAIHGKANTGTKAEQVESYNRRKNGAKELKDTLDTWFATANLVLLGDFNDGLVRTIAPLTGADTVSSYNGLVADSFDANHYFAPTLPLANGLLGSTVGFKSVIDNVMLSDDMKPWYISGSASIYSSVSMIPNYAKGTSDHYPVITRYSFSNTLPVLLESFTVEKKSSAVELEWTVNAGIFKAFEVERSANGRKFERIGKLFGGNTRYSFTDLSPIQGSNYYRLKMIEKDKVALYSPVRQIRFENSLYVKLFTGGPGNKLQVAIQSSHPASAITITDAGGKTIFKKEYNLPAGRETGIEVDPGNWPKGLYFIVVNAGAERKAEIFIKR